MKRLSGRVGEWEKKILSFSPFPPFSLSPTRSFVLPLFPSPPLPLSLFIVGILLVGCASSPNKGKLIEQYSEFGIKAAQAGLWNESIMRWKRVLELDPNNAAAHNNLGVAHEAQGKYEEAIAEYNKAIELEPNNKNYKKNYLKCQRNHAKLENNTQNNKRNSKENNEVSPDEPGADEK